MTKRIFCVLLVALLLLAGCGPREAVNTPVENAPQSTGPVDIPFTLGICENGYTEDYFTKPDAEVHIARTRDEFQALCPDVEKYDDAFFAEHALVCLLQKHNSGSIRDEVTALTRHGDQLVLSYNTLIPGVQTMDLAYWYILLEVDKSAVEGVTTVSLNQTTVNLPSSP